jgi:hypothetical protein
VRQTFREYADSGSPGQGPVAGVEGLEVLRYLRVLVLGTVDGNTSGELEKRAYRRDLPEAVFGEKSGISRQHAVNDERVDEGVGVIDGVNQRTVARYALRSFDLHLAVEDRGEEARKNSRRIPGYFSRHLPLPDRPTCLI